MPGFRNHIQEAIALNRERRILYARMTGNKSHRLSSFLILMERLVLPLAWYYDLRARRWNKQGLGIVRDDFMSMLVRDPSAAIVQNQALTSSHISVINQRRKRFLYEIKSAESLSIKLSIATRFLQWITGFENDQRIHLAMLSHIVESYCLIAENGMKYSEMSSGKTERLTNGLLWWHAIAIRHSMKVDTAANQFHQLGIGIIVNDLPELTKSVPSLARVEKQ